MRTSKWVLVIGLWFAGTFTAQAFNPCAKDYTPINNHYKTGIAFVVQKCGGQPSVIIGTMHSDDPKLMEMHQKSIPILKAAKNGLFEIRFDNAAIQKTIATMFYNVGGNQTLRSEAGDELHDRFMKAVGKESKMNEYLKPWSAAVMLQYPKDVADGVELDLKLQKMADDNKVNIVGLEQVEEQLSIFNDLPKDEQLQALRDVLDNLDKNIEMQNKMQEAYLAKDLRGLEALIPESIDLSTDKEAAKRLMKKLVDDRNVRMADRMVKYIDEGNAFVAIGALHLPGNIGVLKLLEDKGYRIEVLY